ncbi:hypothetical protein HQ865_18995 [Mucilaginibacter mali]|uniref:Uncharacterized protein n=1 Tax=Mucilaginibacter mali TaxID=2740462 RepID=A0A7D4QBQ2_9SPHI|nr:hypothetical protein [Mucilaginibacter mali]QKJ31765.1 hypothetical protein HQ865_18995 [Mucilaginibacter mali]
MKKLIFASALVLSSLMFKTADAQLKINFNLNIGSQPDWGPTGYDHVEYYYMPDIDAYYYVPGHQYIYLQNNAWVRTTTLPARYRNYDVYHGYKVVINQPDPWRNNTAIRAKYARYKGVRTQTVIRDSRDKKYKDHWHGDANGGHYDNGRGHDDHGRGNDHGRPDRGHGHN